MRASALFVAALALASSGCYTIGYDADPALGEAIAVPILRNETLRRGLEYDLTRALRREILETTPFHLASAGPDVPVLRGTIERVDEEPLVTDALERVLYGSVRIQVRFGLYRGARLVLGEDTDGDGAPDGEFRVQGLAERDTGRGEDRLTASRETLADLAEMIALSLQDRHDDRHEPNQSSDEAALLRPGKQHALIWRDSDWFQLEVPERQRVRVVLFESGGLRLSLLDAKGRSLPGLRSVDGGRLQEWIGGLEARRVYLRVERAESEATGRAPRYQLEATLHPDDAAEPDQDPEAATALAAGDRVSRIARDEDWFSAERDAGAACLFRLRAGEALELEVTDADGLPLGAERASQVEEAGGGRLIRVEPASEAGRVYLRVGGANETPIPYTLERVR